MTYTNELSNSINNMRNALKTESGLTPFIGREFTRNELYNGHYFGYTIESLQKHGVIEVVRAEAINPKLVNKEKEEMMTRGEFYNLPNEIQQCLLENGYALYAKEFPTDYYGECCKYIYKVNECALKKFALDAKAHLFYVEECITDKIKWQEKRLKKIRDLKNEI